MPKTLKQLKAIWNKEEKHYQIQEIGSGVQSFVREMLRSPDLFDLGVCPLSKKRETRKMEFIHEKTTKEGRQADFVIYVDQDIIIPVEVESFGKIESGVKQLANYQHDLEKKYGILTDGNTWRFYTDNVYRSFALTNIFKNPQLFLEYWHEYIKPETYYLQFFEEKGQLSLLGTDILFVEDHRPLFFDNITELIQKFKNKLRLEGYFNNVTEKEKDKRATEITYAYIIQFILYKTLVDNDFGTFGKEYEEIVNSIHNSIRKRNYAKILGIIDWISGKISENVYRPFAQEQEFIHKKLLRLFHQPENKLSDVSPWLDIFVFVKKYSFQNVRNEIFGFIYENYLKGLFEEGRKGQYFTDPAVVNFMIKQVGYSAEDLKHKIRRGQLDKLSIVDPSCGSGTFLYSAVNEIIEAVPNGSEKSSEMTEEIVTNNVFGLDIEEFPLYLAEMNIIMRMLPLIISEKYNNPIDKKIKVFKTKDSIAEFIHSGMEKTNADIGVSGGQRFLFPIDLGYDSYVRDEGDLSEMKQSMRPPRRRFDFVIGNPPYVSYNECSKQGVLIFDLIKDGKVKLNNIYGMNLHSAPERRKKYSPKPNLYAFFIALGISLLKDNGRLCYIIPQTILVNNDFDVLRYHLAKYTTIEKIITFREKMFIERGLKQKKPVITSSLVFVAQRKLPSKSHKVEIINYKNPNDEIEICLQNILNNREISKKKVWQTELLHNFANWNLFKQSKAFLNFYEEYRKNSDNIAKYYDHSLAKYEFESQFYFDGSTNIPKKDIVYETKSDIENYYLIPVLKSSGFRINTNGYYPKNKKIKIAKGSQGLIVAQPEYKIIWKYINFDGFYYIKGKNILPIYQQYCITSDNENEIYYLFALLTSKVVLLILNTLLKVEHEEKLSFLLGLSHIKEFVRVPKIIKANRPLKEEIIKKTEEMLNLEDVKLSNLVNFSGILTQQFDDAKVIANHLILTKGQRETELMIDSHPNLAKSAVEGLFPSDRLKFETPKISLAAVKELPVIDFEMRNRIKDYIDDLVFALYFDVPFKKIGFDKAKKIKADLRKNRSYALIEKYNI